MGEQRPMFRFRLPWMQSSAPAPPTPVATQNPPQNETPSTTSQPQASTEPDVKPLMPAQTPSRLQRIPQAQPPPPTEPTDKSQSLSGPITIASAPTIPPLWSPKISAAPETKSQSQNSYQPTSPSRTQPQINPQLPSPQFSATSQPPSPSYATPQFSATSQLPSPQSSAISRPPSPWEIPSQEYDTSQLPSPKSVPQPSSPKSTPQPSSPWRKKLKSSNGDRVSFQNEIRSDISKLVDKMAAVDPENFKDEKVNVVALVGTNKGASMQLGFGSVRRGEETKMTNKTEPVAGTEKNAKKTSAKRGWLGDEVNKGDQMTKAVINNNVQDINNSILMNSFFTERNPGVHLALYYDATQPIKSYDKIGSPGALQGKVSSTASQN